ncbi:MULTISPECIES: methyltransferase family protein [Mycolicibacterium]|nr:isoprenylcysteine carboxylmethyltransferase family protein [Mycolicibacterium bacteremicum]
MSMAVWATVAYVVFAAICFGWRSWVQFQRTGSAGFHGVSGHVGSVEWFAGVGFAVAMVLGLAAPALQAAGALSPLPWLNAAPVQGVGVATALVGIVGTVAAQRAMGASWRIGVDPAETTTLVRDGVFCVVRNPVFTAMLVFGAGLTLMAPNWLAVIGFGILVASIHAQVWLVEEPYLTSRHGQDYVDYTTDVGRFVPLLGRSRR